MLAYRGDLGILMKIHTGEKIHIQYFNALIWINDTPKNNVRRNLVTSDILRLTHSNTDRELVPRWI